MKPWLSPGFAVALVLSPAAARSADLLVVPIPRGPVYSEPVYPAPPPVYPAPPPVYSAPIYPDRRYPPPVYRDPGYYAPEYSHAVPRPRSDRAGLRRGAARTPLRGGAA